MSTKLYIKSFFNIFSRCLLASIISTVLFFIMNLSITHIPDDNFMFPKIMLFGIFNGISTSFIITFRNTGIGWIKLLAYALLKILLTTFLYIIILYNNLVIKLFDFLEKHNMGEYETDWGIIFAWGFFIFCSLISLYIFLQISNNKWKMVN